MTAEDAAWSLQRAVKLNKTPAFILTQFGFTAGKRRRDDQGDRARPSCTITTDKAYAPSFFYNILTSIVASVVDKKEAMAHEANGDFGYEWLKTNSAGSGPYMLRSWKPNDSIMLEAVGDYWGGDVALKRVFVRHVPEPATRRLLLENGDIDIARRLPPNDVAGDRRQSRRSRCSDEQRGRIFYLAANQKNEIAEQTRRCIEALKYLVDYEGMVNSFLKGQIRRAPDASCRSASSARSTTSPTRSTSRRRRRCSPRPAIRTASTSSSPSATSRSAMDIAQAIQNTLAQAGMQRRDQVPAPAPRCSATTAPASTS